MLQPLILNIFALNLQIYESFYIGKLIPNNETYSSTANIFLTIFTLVLIPNISPENWVWVGLFNCLF